MRGQREVAGFPALPAEDARRDPVAEGAWRAEGLAGEGTGSSAQQEQDGGRVVGESDCSQETEEDRPPRRWLPRLIFLLLPLCPQGPFQSKNYQIALERKVRKAQIQNSSNSHL